MTKTRTLNKSKPFAVISGRDPSIPPGAAYEQNNLYFDASFNEIGKITDEGYKAADSDDVAGDLAAENAELQRKLAEAEAKLGTLGDPGTGLDKNAIIEKLEELNVPHDGRLSADKLYGILQAHLDAE